MGFSVRWFRWVPLILLVLGVVVMHHVPAHSAAHRAPSTAHAASGAGLAEHEMTAASLGAPVAVAGAPSMPAHDPLHLCLAILAGLALLLLPLLGNAIRPVPVLAGSAAVPVRSRPRAPPSVPRRLAELCVLRL
ncbi:hypothetical protein OOZ19_03880 [Saccharopolyspora sp. NFXS83]|uniref:hypothetical protein n=1 Tax=Saccharopolyspora sp. NFXS83 TaxID=2993560 RepID=UPI00224B2E37|nr:hypothetical protein [Saccharopolyspora sp. NFXS83]MCX2729369.1 hypothetical protein [Saccharopolyspora sp. NFXS83]